MASEDIWLSECVEDDLEKYVWHFDMLNHDERTAAFKDAFRRLPETALLKSIDNKKNAKSRCQNGLVLDLGCGSGLLGLMLLTQRPDCTSAQVVSVEADSELALVARDNVGKSSLSNRIEVCSCFSTDLGRSVQSSMLDRQRANLVISELFDSALLGEGVLPSLRDASRRLLTPGYYSVPCRAEVYGVVVESAFLRNWQHLTCANGLPAIPQDWRRNCGDARPHEVNLQRLLQSASARKLTKHFKAFSIDFEALPPKSGQHVSLQVECLEHGSADAVVFWWRCVMVRGDLDDSRSATLHNDPSMPGDPDHWRQAVCILSAEKNGRTCCRGEFLHIQASHNDDFIWFRLENVPAAPLLVRHMPTTPHIASSRLSEMSSWRLRMLNDRDRTEWLANAVDTCLRKTCSREYQKVIADLSQGGLLSSLCLAWLCRNTGEQMAPFISRRLRHLLLAAREHRRRRGRKAVGSPQIIAMGTGRQVGYDLAEAVWSKCGLRQRCKARAPELFFTSSSPESIGVLLAEPYDGNVEERECDLQCWQHWAQVHDFRTALHEASIVFPSRFRVRVAAMSCAPLWQRRRRIAGRKIGDADVGKMDRLASERHFPWATSSAADGRARFPCELWQQEHWLLSESDDVLNESVTSICDVDVVSTSLQQLTFPSVRLYLDAVQVAKLGVYALATWTEIASPADAAGPAWWSTARIQKTSDCGGLRFAPGAYKQGVLLAEHPYERECSEATNWSASATARPLKRQRKSKAAPTWIDVKAIFSPSRGELRLMATWDNGDAF